MTHSWIRAALIAATLGLFGAGCATANNVWPDDAGFLLVKDSPHDVATTLDRLESAATARGATVFARIDHAQGARAVGTPIPEAQVLIFGNPRIGTPLIQAAPSIALDLPIRVLAWEDAGEVYLATTAPAALARRHGLSPDDPALEPLRLALAGLMEAAVSPTSAPEAP